MSNIVEQMVSNALWGGGGSGGGSSGGGLPTGGAAHQMLVTDAEGKAEWQELLCYETQETVAVMVETEMTFDEDAFYGANPLLTDIVVGDTYTITYNGVDYPCPAYALDGYAFGNLGAVVEGMPTTDDPFILIAFPPEIGDSMGGMYAMLMALDGAETVTISISGIAKTVKKLDAKYAPGYGFGDFPYKDRVFLEETTVASQSGTIYFNAPLVPEQTYTVTCNGTAYTVTTEKSNVVSDGIVLEQEDGDGNTIFSIHAQRSNLSLGMTISNKSTTLTLSIIGSGTERILIPDKYIEQAPFIINAEVNLDEETDSVYCDRKQIYDAYKANRPIFVYLKNTGSSSYYGMLLPLTYYNGAGGYFFFEQYLFGAEYGYHVEIDLDGNLVFEKIHPNYKNLTLTSPNGTAYKITVSDDGTLSATAV